MSEFMDDQLAEKEPCKPVVYQLVCDDDGHWYVIKTTEEHNFYRWVRDTVNGDDSKYDFEPCRVGGSPSLVKFPSYWIR
jgi:hypothetical protein